MIWDELTGTSNYVAIYMSISHDLANENRAYSPAPAATNKNWYID